MSADIGRLVAELQDRSDGYTRLWATTEPEIAQLSQLVAVTVPPRRTLLDRLLGRRA